MAQLAALIFLGQISYPVYLVHGVVRFQTIRFGIAEGWSTPGGVIAAAAVSIALATLLHYMVELPGERWSRSKLRQLRAALA